MSTVWTIEQAIIAALNADVAWLALAGEGKVYSSQAPEGAELPYAVISDVNERKQSRVFGGGNVGYDNQRFINLYSDELGKEKCSSMYRIVLYALDGTILVLSEDRMIKGDLNLISMTPDPSGSGDRAIVSYSTVSRQ